MAVIHEFGSMYKCYVIEGKDGLVLVDTGLPGMSLKAYGVDAVVHELPGHTQGSIGLMVNGDQFIVGDAMMNMMRATQKILRFTQDDNEMRFTLRTEVI